MFNIEQLRQLNQAENYVVTMHGRRRMNERGILLGDVMSAVDRGEIIEIHPEDYPFPSCLVLGLSIRETYLHAVVSLNEGYIYLITAYFPSPDEWEPDMKTRRKKDV